jgi:hypothetical protein
MYVAVQYRQSAGRIPRLGSTSKLEFRGPRWERPLEGLVKRRVQVGVSNLGNGFCGWRQFGFRAWPARSGNCARLACMSALPVSWQHRPNELRYQDSARRRSGRSVQIINLIGGDLKLESPHKCPKLKVSSTIAALPAQTILALIRTPYSFDRQRLGGQHWRASRMRALQHKAENAAARRITVPQSGPLANGAFE